MPIVLGLDLGTTSLAALAVNEQGETLVISRHDNDSAVAGLPAGYAEQNPYRIREMSFHLLREVTSVLPEDPVALGVAGQMHGLLAVDQQRKPLTNLISWQDRRANEPRPGSSQTWLDSILQRVSDADSHNTGCRLSPGYLGVTLHILQSQGMLPEATHRVCLLADWIAAEIAKADICCDRGNAASTGLYDLKNDRWSAPLLRALNIPERLLSPVKDSGAVAGIVGEETSPPTGLPEGLPVINAIGDNQAAVLGSVPAGERAIQINVGTGGQINWPIERFDRVPRMDTRWLPLDRLMLVGAGLVGGDAFAWVTNTVNQWLAAFGVSLSRNEIFARLSELISQTPPDNQGLACQPTFRGTRHEPHARGSFTGIAPENFTPGHLARAVLQGIADGFYGFYEQAGPLQPTEATKIIGTGNGLQKNPLLQQLLANRFRRPLLMPRQEESAAYGAALLAGVAVKVWPDLAAAGKVIDHILVAEPSW